MPPPNPDYNWDDIWKQQRAPGDGPPEQSLNFGNIAICEKCGVSLPADEAQVIPRTIYQERAPGVSETIRTNLIVCPRCLRKVVRTNQWMEVRHWLLLIGVGLLIALALFLFVLRTQRLEKKREQTSVSRPPHALFVISPHGLPNTPSSTRPIL